ncbi:MAG: hypothetical protein WCP31_10660 [Chloroflexales bacterium]
MASRQVRANNPLPLIIIGLVVLAALGGGGYWYFMQQAQTTSDANATATSAAEQAISAAQTTTSADIQATSLAATAAAQATKTAQDAEIERQYQAAVAYQTATDYEQARTAFRALIAAQPGYKDTADRLRQVSETLTEAYYQQGMAAVKEKFWSDAVKNFDLALAITPNYKDAAAQRAAANRELTTTPTPLPSATLAPSATADPAAATPTTAATTTGATATPASQAAFRDTFDVTMSDKWQIVDKGLSVVNGQLVGNEGTLIYKPDRNNYIITTQVASKNFRILFRTDGKQGYSLRCEYGNCYWQKFRDYGPDPLSTAVFSAALNDGEPHIVSVEVRGEDFLAYVDSDLLFSVRDNTYPTGSVGLAARANSAFDNFEVTLR